jgi:hypothetical protein
VPAVADFVSVLRVASRVLAGRAGRRADARTRLQASVGTAFFAIVERSAPGTSVVTLLAADADRVELTFLLDPSGEPLTPDAVAGLVTDHELSPDGRSLRLWVGD